MDYQALRNLDSIMEGRLPEKPTETFDMQTDALKEASDAELEKLLADPALHSPENMAVRNEVVGLLNDRLNPKRVNELMQDVDVHQAASVTRMATGQEVIDPDRTAAERAREALGEEGCPLAELIPDEVRHFIIDPDGTFYLELEEAHQFQMEDFELVMEQTLTGVLQPMHLHSINGLTARKELNNKTVEIQFLEMLFEGEGAEMTIKTDHPTVPVVHMRRENFMVL